MSSDNLTCPSCDGEEFALGYRYEDDPWNETETEIECVSCGQTGSPDEHDWWWR